MKPPNGPRSPNSRSGIEVPCNCNICRQTFSSPDDLYDHLDDCILTVLDEEDLTGTINEQLLAEVTDSDLYMLARKSPDSRSPTESRNRMDRGKYPTAWGFHYDQLNLKKRITTVFNGTIRLVRDEMFLLRDLEVRVPLSDGASYVTDLDVMTLSNAEAIFTDLSRSS